MKALILSSILAFSLVACGKGGDTGSGAAGDGAAAAGATVYSSTCSGCHGASGEGTTGYAPAMCEDVPTSDVAELTSVILDGIGDMPAQDLTAQQNADVIAYLQETFTADTCP